MKEIFVTRPDLPPINDLLIHLQRIWSSGILTNGGPLHQELEHNLASYLKVPYVSLFCNGTMALATALKVLGIRGEVITTPFTFVATTEALTWNGLIPVYADTGTDSFNICPADIERKITSNTSAILGVHCYGFPCDTQAIKEIADNFNLAVLYDAAHAFGVSCDCESLLSHGDLSVLSFHATKVFNTFEGGAIVSHDISTKKRIDRIKNFGFINETTIGVAGINAKMSEINAAIGLAQLAHIESYIEKRKEVAQRYAVRLSCLKHVTMPSYDSVKSHNYSYFPLLINQSSPLSRDEIYSSLREFGIFSRRYFYPLIPEFTLYREFCDDISRDLPNAFFLSRKVLCLPLYSSLALEEVDYIADKLTIILSS